MNMVLNIILQIALLITIISHSNAMEDQGKAQNENDQMIMVGREERKKPVYRYTFLFIYNKS